MFARNAVLVAIVVLGAGLWIRVPAATPASPAAPATTTPSAALQKQAATGDAAAEAKLGLELMKTKKPADESAAVDWFRKAAAQGNTDSQFNLGLAYATGAGITRDVPTGLKWMRESLSDGSGTHMLVYGMLLGSLGGGSQQEALKWIRKSAEAGAPAGMMFLAMAEQKDDPADARRWMLKAAQAGSPLPQMLLGWGYILGKGMFDSPNTDAGLHWLRKAANQGYAPAEGALGLLLITGDHQVPDDPAEGVQWAQKAAAQHNAYGYYAMGYAYQLGKGESVDPAKAWYNFAAAQRLDTKHNLTKAGEDMSLVATELSPAQIQKLQAEVAQIPVSKKNTGTGNIGNNFNSSNK
ncbi:MAG TPA: tetratricopeptide repeat protein [Rhodanobacteraceae bacterium]|jgi:TPR repeat protein